MKLKRLPEDFRVEELADVRPDGGPFALYRLEKTSLGTLEALEAIRRCWNLDRARVGYGGLKDKHAATCQFVTVRQGPRQDLEQERFLLRYLGQTREAFGPQGIVGNRFRIVLRDLGRDAAEAVLREAARLPQVGLPNYFDDQRFGSLGESGEFIARPWCRGDFERALWLALAEPNEHDRADDRAEKETIRRRWKDWPTCKAELPRSSRRSIVTYLLDHPLDFRRAFALLPVELRSLWLAAFQSRLWNDLVADRLREVLGPEQRIDLEAGDTVLPFAQELDATQSSALANASLPLPSARLHFAEGDPLIAPYERVLAKHGLTLRELRVKYPRDSFFSKGTRRVWLSGCRPTATREPDDLHAGRSKIVLAFDLPRGSYATIVVKWLTRRDEGRGTSGDGQTRTEPRTK